MSAIQSYSSFIDQKILIPSDPTGEWKVVSPANSDEIYAKCIYDYSQIDFAVKAAAQSFQTWKTKSFDDRKTILIRAFKNLDESEAEWLSVASVELGRTPKDFELERRQLKSCCDAIESLKATDLLPRGVTAIVSSYVWPLYYTTHFTFMNLLAGNTVVVKPSEKATLVILKWVEILSRDAEMAPLIQVLIGEKEVGRRLVCHEQVQTVVFMGSFEVGMRIKQDTLGQSSKEVLLYLGSKTAAILTEDFDGEKALPDLIQDSFLSAGQHCRSASVIFVHSSRYEKFCGEFHALAKQFSIGSFHDNAFAGPLIDGSMVDRYLKFSGISEREGAQVLMRGKPLSSNQKGYFVTPTVVAFNSMSADQMKKSVSLQTEILSPHVSIVQYQSDAELIEVMSQMQHGLSVSIWGADPIRLKKFARALQVGEVLFNQSLLEWNSAISFQARKKSGNHAYHGVRLIEQLSYLKSI